MLVGHIQGSWGTEVPAHQTSRSPLLPRGGRGGAVLLRVVAALPFNYCSVRTLEGSLRPHLTPNLFFFRLRLIRILHVRWSLGFVPELVFGLAFGLGGGSSCGGSLFGPVGKAYFAPSFSNGSNVVVPGALVPGGCLKKKGYHMNKSWNALDYWL